MTNFNDFTTEGVQDFYEYILSGNNIIKNYYIWNLTILKTSRGRPKGRVKFREYIDRKGEEQEVFIPFTGAGACGWNSIAERVYFVLHYRNINFKKTFSKKGLYIRGLCSNDGNRTGGIVIKWRNYEDRKRRLK